MTKKLLCVIVSAALALCLPFSTALATGQQQEASLIAAQIDFGDQEATPIGDFTYSTDDATNTLTITKYNGNDATVVVPAQVTIGTVTYHVALNGGVFSGTEDNPNTTLTKVAIQDGVQLINGENLFSYCISLEQVDVSGLKTDNCKNMSHMFYACLSLASIDGISNWNTINCEDMSWLFAACTQLSSVDVSGWETDSVTTLDHVFAWCLSLESLDVSSWHTGNVTNLQRAFMQMPTTTVLDLRSWDVSNVSPDGWTRITLQGPKVILGDSVGTLPDNYPVDGEYQYYGFNTEGDYGVLLGDGTLDRVYCLNKTGGEPAGQLFSLTKVNYLDIQNLESLAGISNATTEHYSVETWQKIIAAIMFFGNDFGYDEQVALQGVIWHYSDDTPFLDSAQEANEAFEPGRASRVADRMAEMVDYVDAHFEDLDYNQVLVNFYACEDQSIQNLLSIETVEGVRYSASSGLKITKSVESANEDAEEPFTFTVKLTNPDSSPYLAYVQAASEGETLHAIGPNANGEITLTTTGAGEAMLENIPLGVTYEVTEAPVNGWNLKSSTGTSGEIVEDTSIAHFVNSDGTNQNNDTPENNTPPNNDTPKNDTPPANTTPPDAIPPANNDTPEDDDVPENTTPPTTAPNNDTPPAAVPDNDTPKNDDTTPGNTVENTQPATMANVTMPKTEDPIVTWPLALIASSSLAVMLVANRKRRAL